MNSNSQKTFDVFEEYSKDYIFRVLLHSVCTERDKCVAGIANMIEKHGTCHPLLDKMVNHMKHGKYEPKYQKAVFLFALHCNEEFTSYILEQPGVCKISLSLFKHNRLPHHCKLLLDGNTNVLDFVINCTTDYICT